MVQFANITPAAETNGIPYATGTVLTSLETDLYNQLNPAPPLAAPVCLTFQQALVASVAFTINSATPQTYVVLQTDTGDGNWIDVAWCVTALTSGSLLYCLSAGIAGANAILQSRKGGTAPAANGSNQLPLGARFRFVGATGVFSSQVASSLASGTSGVPGVTVNIRYKLLPLR